MKTIFLSFRYLLPVSFLVLLVFSASATSLKNNGIYRVTSFSVQRALSPINSTSSAGQPIVLYTKTLSNTQCWRAVLDNTGQYYTFTNIGTGRVMNVSSITQNTGLSQASVGAPNSKWVVEPVAGYANCFYLSHFKLAPDKRKLFIQVPASSVSTPEEAIVKIDYEPSEGDSELHRIWLFEEMPEALNAPSVESFADIFQSWKKAYYKPHIAGGYMLGAPGFWNVAEMMEILLDAYEVTGHVEYKTMFYNVYSNFYKTQGNRNGNWMSNPYNDDLVWIVIACLRANILFRDNSFLPIAKFHFDNMYARALLPTGGLRWKEDFGDSSNSCVNGPAQVAACYLAQLTGDATYYQKAKGIYDYQYRVLYDKATGRVFDSALGEEVTNNWASTYNQGTFLGANLMLYDYYKDPKYLAEAHKIAAYTRGAMYNNGVMNNESGRDLDGFKGILMRYLRKYIIDQHQPFFIQWLHLNARTAYNNRNSVGLIGTLWGTKTQEGVPDVFAASTAVSLIVNTPMSSNLRKNAFDVIEAEDFDYISGPIAEACSEGTENLGAIKGDYYVGYMNVNFGSLPATNAEFRVSSITAGGTIEVRLGSPTGDLMGTVEIPNSNAWDNYITVNTSLTPTTGIQSLYLVFRGTDFIANLNWFKFVANETSLEKPISNHMLISPNCVRRGENLHISTASPGIVTVFSQNGLVVLKKGVDVGSYISTDNLVSGYYFMEFENKTEMPRHGSFLVK